MFVKRKDKNIQLTFLISDLKAKIKEDLAPLNIILIVKKKKKEEEEEEEERNSNITY